MKVGILTAIITSLYLSTHSVMAATTYQFSAVITESYFESSGVYEPYLWGEIDKDGWRYGDTVSATFIYDNARATGGEFTSWLTLQIGDYVYNGYGSDRLHATNGEVDSIRFWGEGDYYDPSVSILFEDATGNLFPGDAEPVLPDELNLADFTSITLFYVQVIEAPYSGLEEYVTARVVPLPAAVWLFISGLLTLSCFKKRTIA